MSRVSYCVILCHIELSSIVSDVSDVSDATFTQNLKYRQKKYSLTKPFESNNWKVF